MSTDATTKEDVILPEDPGTDTPDHWQPHTPPPEPGPVPAPQPLVGPPVSTPDHWQPHTPPKD